MLFQTFKSWFRLKERYIVSACEWGLGNRLVCLITSLRWAKRLRAKPLLYWLPNEYCFCSFRDLFENDVEEIDENRMNAILSPKNEYKKYYNIFKFTKLIAFPREVSEKDFPRKPYELGPGLTIEHGKIPLRVQKNFLRYFDRLIPIEYIRQEVDAFSRNFTNKTISLAIRSWAECKDTDHHGLRMRGIADDFEMCKITDIITDNNGADFFITADSGDIIKELQRKYGDRILYYPKKAKQGDRASVQGIQEALIDMLLLSKNSHIIGTHRSTFAEVAWWMGGGKAKFEVF